MSMQAVVIQDHKAVIKEIPVPEISAQEVLVKIHAASLNPTDWKLVAFRGPEGACTGCDFSGTVAKVGGAVETLKEGDRVAGFVHGGLYEDQGSFTKYLKVNQELVWKVPASVSMDEAPTFGIGGCTAYQTVVLTLGVPLYPGKAVDSPSIFIYGGSTSVSLFAIQLAKLAGYTVITVCSPHSNDLVKSYGADHVYDYRSPTCEADILANHPDVPLALDGISEGPSTKLCTSVVASAKGKVVTLVPNADGAERDGVTITRTLAYTLLGNAFQYDKDFVKAVPEDRIALTRFYARMPDLIEAGFKANPIEVREGGLEAIIQGLADLRDKKVSGKKLVVRID